MNSKLKPSETWLQILLDIARGMEYVHSLNPPILHKDLTMQNV